MLKQSLTEKQRELVYMSVGAVEHKNKKGSIKKYVTYKFVDSVQEERGPPQTTILNL